MGVPRAADQALACAVDWKKNAEGTYFESGVVTCDLGTLAAGASESRTIVLRPTTTGNLTVTATVTGAEDIDRNPTNDSATTSTTVVPGQIVTFDDLPGQNQALNGQYPTGIIDWGYDQWYHSAPSELFTSNSLSLRRANQTSATFNFVTPRRLVSIEAFNGSTVASTVTLSCSGPYTLPARTVSVAVNKRLIIETDWTTSCTTVTIGSTNGWNTHFDNLVHEWMLTPP